MATRDTKDAIPLEAQDARRLLLDTTGLLQDPRRRCAPATVQRLIERMGFVQLDSINMVARAHHLTLATRLDDYRKDHLKTLLERRRSLFEHWTHDASAIPVAWYVPWRHMCTSMTEKSWAARWVRSQLGRNWRAALRRVLERVRVHGPMMSRDFEKPRGGKSGAWWGWKPAKAALEYLWWSGDLAVSRRVHFHKVYDLAERCYPALVAAEPPSRKTFVDWACREATERLIVATPKEIRDFHAAVSIDEAKAWCTSEIDAGRLLPAVLTSEDGTAPRPTLALPDVRRRIGRANRALGTLPDRMRLVSPFDPTIRERARAKRLFGFDYRFEAFTPAAKRVYGYYVLPVLRGDRFVARADLKLHRKQGLLEVRSLAWEPKRGRTKIERRLFEEALGRLAVTLGAERIEIPRSASAR